EQNGNAVSTILKFSSNGTRTVFGSADSNYMTEALAIDTSGNIYAMAVNNGDTNLASVAYKFTPTGARSVFAKFPGQGFGLVFDTAGNLYAAAGDRSGNLGVFKITPNGTE